MQSSEYEAAHASGYTVAEWVDFPGAEYRLIEGDEQIARDLRVVSTPGHTVGHQSVLVETVEGPVVLAGQAIYSRAEYDHISSTGEVPPEDPPPDPKTYLQSAQRLIDLRARRVFFSHDDNVFERDDD